MLVWWPEVCVEDCARWSVPESDVSDGPSVRRHRSDRAVVFEKVPLRLDWGVVSGVSLEVGTAGVRSLHSGVFRRGCGVGGTSDVWMAGGGVAFAGAVWPVCVEVSWLVPPVGGASQGW